MNSTTRHHVQVEDYKQGVFSSTLTLLQCQNILFRIFRRSMKTPAGLFELSKFVPSASSDPVT